MTIGYVVARKLNVRETYSRGAAIVMQLTRNTPVNILGQKTTRDNTVWYNIGEDQWVMADYVQLEKRKVEEPVSG